MSDDTPTPNDDKPAGGDWKAPADQAELDAIVEKRLARERARFADYDDLKAKAAEFDKAEAASKSDLEKALERADKAEKASAARELEANRASVALAKGLTPSQAKRLVGSTVAELEADADELLADLANGEKPSSPPKPPGGSGAAPRGGEDDGDRALARQLFGANN